MNSTIRPPPPPPEYEQFQLCRALGKLPHELDELPDETYRTFLEFLYLERETDRIRGLQRQFYGK